MFKSVLRDIKRGDGQRSVDRINELSISSYVNSGSLRKTIVFQIGVNILKKARYMIGDYVDIQQSEDGQYGLIKRVTDGGRKISSSLSQKERKAGRSPSTGTVSFKSVESLDHVSKQVFIENVCIKDEGILFDWPQKTTTP